MFDLDTDHINAVRPLPSSKMKAPTLKNKSLLHKKFIHSSMQSQVLIDAPQLIIADNTPNFYTSTF